MTSEADPNLGEFASDLEALLTGQLGRDTFESKYRAGARPRVSSELMSSVLHFLSDCDIRARDAEYRAMQEGEMRRLITSIRAGRLEAARRITCLRPTRDPE